MGSNQGKFSGRVYFRNWINLISFRVYIKITFSSLLTMLNDKSNFHNNILMNMAFLKGDVLLTHF